MAQTSAGPAEEVPDDVAPDSRTARYLYAVCRGLDPASLRGLTGLAGAPLELVAHESLVAVVSSVPLAEFGEEALRRNLEQLSWLEPVISVHDEVVRAAASAAPTAPLRLATVCFDDDAVRRRLREWYVPLMHALDRVEGRAEWSVKVVAPPQAADSAADTSVVSGADYLRRKKAEAQGRATSEAAAQDVARAIHDRLSTLAVADRELAPQDPRLSGHRGVMVLNAAYLVPLETTDAFAQEVARVAAEHPDVVVDGRGPWPPYSFAMLEQR